MADGAVVALDKPKQSFMTLSAAGGIIPTTYEECWRIAETLAKSKLVRKDFQGQPENVMLVLMQGLELGLKPIAALTQIYVVDAVPSLSSKLKLALVRQHPVCEYITCTFSDEKKATFKAKRRDQPHPIELSFTIEEAKAAGLTSKDNWKYPKTMLRWRCAGQLIDLEFSDVTGGVRSYDEAREIGGRLVTGDVIMRSVGKAPPPDDVPDEEDDSAVFDQVARQQAGKPAEQEQPAEEALPLEPPPSAPRPQREMSPEEKLHALIKEATEPEHLKPLVDRIQQEVKNVDLRKELTQAWTRKFTELKKNGGGGK